ncbi:MAG: flagellar basal body P-ring protein FlgI, partial [bacterium]|nr:flagellar basal body P-ring protein FlgI [bacterium]
MKPPTAYATLLYLMFGLCPAFAQPNFNSSPPSMFPYAQPEEVFASPVMPQVTPPRATEADYANVDLNSSVRIKDITFIEGERINHLSGEGLVFGLSGTGGRAEQTRRMAANYFLRKGLQVRTVDTQNMSAVLVSGRIPAYARKGETILVTVSVADDATSLRGGTLHQTVLRGIDDEIYAVAQGPVIGSGIAAQGQAASVQSNHPTVGVCEAIVEREIPCQNIVRGNAIRLILRNKSYSTATVVMNALNTVFPGHANALDSGTVEVVIPNAFRESLPTMISMIGDLRVTPDLPARVVIN